jgi:AmmeMemoRadiSam system protein B
VKKNSGLQPRRILDKESEYVRPPAVAGLFYPSHPEELAGSIRELLARARENLEGKAPEKISIIISPHAGYPYSGFTAAHGYSLLCKGQFKTVVVVSPSHREYFDGVSVFSGKAFSTPLGEIEIDQDLKRELLETAGDFVVESQQGHKTEHAVEVQLPFLQVSLGGFKLVPLVMGDQKREYCRTLGEALGKVVERQGTLLVASSDLSHYYDYDTANEIDQVCEDDIVRMDPGKMMDDLENRRCEACGGGPIVSCLYAGKALGVKTASVLYRCNSGDSSGDKSAVVGYLSAVLS